MYILSSLRRAKLKLIQTEKLCLISLSDLRTSALQYYCLKYLHISCLCCNVNCLKKILEFEVPKSFDFTVETHHIFIALSNTYKYVKNYVACILFCQGAAIYLRTKL